MLVVKLLDTVEQAAEAAAGLRGDGDEWRALVQDRKHPLSNRAVQGQFPPGSTFKPFTLAAALENDVSLATQGFNSDSNALHLFWQDGDKILPLERKELLAVRPV